MGKLIYFVSLLVLTDILFLVTGQLNIQSPSSVIINTIIDPSNISNLNFWSILITGLSALSAVAVVIIGIATRQSDTLIFIPMGISLSLLIGDYITIFDYLASLNNVFATILLIPTIVIFSLVIVEWVRGKD